MSVGAEVDELLHRSILKAAEDEDCEAMGWSNPATRRATLNDFIAAWKAHQPGKTTVVTQHGLFERLDKLLGG